MFDINFRKVPVLGYAIGWLESNNFDYGLGVMIIALLLLFFAFSSSSTLASSSFSFFFTLAPIWLPILLLLIFWFKWMDFVGKKFWLFNGRITYRIKLPQEVKKSPEAMEFVLNQIWNKQTPDNFWQTYIDGKRPQPIGLEIVSIGGDVRFYININKKKGPEMLSSAFYSQYPGVEIIEEPVDYAAEIPIGDPEWLLMSTHMGKKEKKWGPIKTYIDFGHDKLPDEDEKVDPMTPLLERLGSISPHERIYVQFVISAVRKKSFSNGQLIFGESPGWTAEAQARVDELMRRDPSTKAPLTKDDRGVDLEGAPRITPGERNDIEAIERNLEKDAYDVGIRYIYAAKKGHFNGNILNSLNRMFNQFDVVGRATIGVRWRTDFDYKWFSDPFGDRLDALRKQEHKEFKLRRYFPKCQVDGEKVMTVEELATMFHLPGKVALTPSLGRVPSLRSQAPSNLPVGDPSEL